MTGPEAEAMIRHGVMVNALLPNRDTLLSLACIWGNREVVRALLHYRADVNGHKYGGSIPLHIAAQNGHVEVIRLLASSGADLNKKDANGDTALHRATIDSGRKTGTPQLLVAFGANPCCVTVRDAWRLTC